MGQPFRGFNGHQRNRQGIEIKQEKYPGGPFVDGQHKRPVLDTVARVGPLIGIVVAQFDGAGIDPVAVNENSGNPAAGHIGIVSQVNPVVIGFVVGQFGIDEGLVFAVQESMGEIADIVHHHGMVRVPGQIRNEIGPRIIPGEFGNFGNLALAGQFRIAGEQPDQAIADLHRVSSQLFLDERFAKAVMRVVLQPAVPVEGPAMVSATQIALIHRAMGELELAVQATILQGGEFAVIATVQGNGGIPESDFFHLFFFNRAVVFHHVPAIRIHAGGAGLLPGILGFRKGGGRGFRLRVVHG